MYVRYKTKWFSFARPEIKVVCESISAEFSVIKKSLGRHNSIATCVQGPFRRFGPGRLDLGPGILDFGPGILDFGPGRLDLGPGRLKRKLLCNAVWRKMLYYGLYYSFIMASITASFWPLLQLYYGLYYSFIMASITASCSKGKKDMKLHVSSSCSSTQSVGRMNGHRYWWTDRQT